MSQIPSNLFLSIGKPVKDEYGRPIGRIISLANTPSGKFESVFIEFSDGRFAKQPIEALAFNGADITLLSKIKSKASVLYDQLPFIWRKDQALKELSEKRKINSELYQELHNSFSNVLSQLRKEAQIIIDDAIQGINRCDEDLKTISYSVLNLELEHEIGKVNDDIYKSSFATLQENTKRITAEKNDLETVKNKLSNFLLGDSPTQHQPKNSSIEVTVADAADLPEPPVVVYVKEVGKAGI